MSIQSALSAASKNHILVDLSYKGLLKLSGEDASTFLQGQVTNDVMLLDANKSHLTGYCNPKGRLLALFYAFKHEGDIHLEFDADCLESIMKRLKMFVMRSKVEVSDASQTARLGVAGENAAEYLLKTFDQIPNSVNEVVSTNGLTVIRLPLSTPAFEIITSDAEAARIKVVLADTFSAQERISWEWLETQSGLPEITTQTKEAFVPQMVNLDVLDGINFKKGCYTGQEIVARTHYLGKVKRRTVLAHIATDATPSAGDTILNAEDQDVGQIVRTSPALNSGIDILFEARIESIEAGHLSWNGNPLSMMQMPYSLVYDK